MARNFKELKNELLKNQDVKMEYDLLEPEYQIRSALVEARKNKHMTQKELSELTGLDQGDISRIEAGDSNPTLQTMIKLAAGVGLELQLVPTEKAM